jgi:hypothetical protein
MGRCILKFDRIEILNQKSDSDHSDNDWLSLVWFINDRPGIEQTVPFRNLQGNKVLHSGDVVSGFEQSIICEDTDIVTAVYTITNLGSLSWEDQAREASRITQQVSRGAADVYLQALEYALRLIGQGMVPGAPPPAVIIAQVLAPVLDKLSGKILDLVDLAFEKVITPVVGWMADQAANLLGHPNCNGEVMHDAFVFLPGADTLISFSKTYEGPQENDYCGSPPHTKIDLTTLRELDVFIGKFGPVIIESQEEMAMRDFRHRAEIAAREGIIGGFPNFYFAAYGRNNVGGTIFLKPGCSEWRDVSWADLGMPALSDFGARMRSTQDYATRNGFVGGFPNFFHAEHLSLKYTASLARSFFSGGSSSISGLVREIVCGTVLVKPGCGEWRDVPLLEIGNPSLTDIGARFRGTQDYATRNGFVGGFPNFYHANYGHGIVCGTILLTAAAAEWRDVLLWLGPA